MKKANLHIVSSIALLSLLLGHVFVVPFVLISRLESEANIHTSSIHEYNSKPEKLSLKIAMSLPYANQWEEAKDSEGLVQIEGEFYTLVSRHLKQDTLYCDYVKNNSAREIFSMLADNVSPDGKEKSPRPNIGQVFCKWLSSQYHNQNDITLSKPVSSVWTSQANYQYTAFSSSTVLQLESPPPQQI
ncbi:hypothetical protein LAG90_18660 [Marinilongibacter aquaticus]|uniref:hypothetical protein n=1 Tax=Marinilongibacter aquaticus TaxID=2975157 RepID=UPI0021BD1708|nr:hypothetical protein [Marinilongibacter aquaticus]UBM58821.1 hypothetical protein LAG90_18660 [Marinilongibacter aquaticus]